MFILHQTISQLVSSSGVLVQSKSRLKAIKTPPWASLALSFRTASKEWGKISEFLISGVNVICQIVTDMILYYVSGIY